MAVIQLKYRQHNRAQEKFRAALNRLDVLWDSYGIDHETYQRLKTAAWNKLFQDDPLLRKLRADAREENIRLGHFHE